MFLICAPASFCIRESTMKIRNLLSIVALALVSAIVHAASLGPVQVYKDPLCGCCGKYVEYLRQEGIRVEVISVSDTAALKERYGIPRELQSCHTSVANGYVIEGHVPVATLKKLVDEGRAIKGIALPGMPPGSPGMGPVKTATLTTYEIPTAGERPKVFSVE